ncbi:tRNA wybutosine-synthesizing protein 5 [Hypsibius exemplaris]|uniref:tRNA wybutosine-synthesizing protein 5 n=1 Tax=Hypsibius exemplaris TaxID=2072580 RepID=A0A9X6RNZ0_HYPEX|nr:tRNA wybutosine-synthesizing protein 5 [Hypsibius exemplaris]
MPPIPVFENPTREFFQTSIQPSRRPAILRHLNIGPCLAKWSPDYLALSVSSHKQVVVHESTCNRLRFLNKNFVYTTLPFCDFVEKAVAGGEKSQNGRKYYYYRALASGDPRSSRADFRADFPELAGDFVFPDVMEPETVFSSVFRCGSADLGLFLHYDVMDNVLCQIRGRKRAILFDPEDVDYLYLQGGDKSLIHDPENVDLNVFPLFAKAASWTCDMDEGDVLFIPAMWMHYMRSIEFSVAVNVFWCNLPREIYDAKDTYGNKDLLPYTRATQGVDRALKQLDVLPRDLQRFYARMLRAKIDKFLTITEPLRKETNGFGCGAAEDCSAQFS